MPCYIFDKSADHLGVNSVPDVFTEFVDNKLKHGADDRFLLPADRLDVLPPEDSIFLPKRDAANCYFL